MTGHCPPPTETSAVAADKSGILKKNVVAEN
jgi:hypothetical protein